VAVLWYADDPALALALREMRAATARRSSAEQVDDASSQRVPLPRLPYTAPASAHRGESSNAALPRVGEITFVGSTITLPQPEKVNEVDAEPSS
jgi:hypothetical protein